LEIETTLSEHREEFALTDLARTRDGYVSKFSRGMVMVVRSCPAAVLDDDTELAALLAQVHRDFDVVEPSRLARDLAPRFARQKARQKAVSLPSSGPISALSRNS